LVNPDDSGAAASEAGLEKLAPDCVDFQTQSGGNRSAQAWNHCESKVRIRFIWAFGEDGQCAQLEVNETHQETRQWPGYFSEIHNC
jgi:hypothetical protein